METHLGSKTPSQPCGTTAGEPTDTHTTHASGKSSQLEGALLRRERRERREGPEQGGAGQRSWLRPCQGLWQGQGFVLRSVATKREEGREGEGPELGGARGSRERRERREGPEQGGAGQPERSWLRPCQGLWQLWRVAPRSTATQREEREEGRARARRGLPEELAEALPKPVTGTRSRAEECGNKERGGEREGGARARRGSGWRGAS
eukprot:112360-Rhodomonas_salina.2